MTRLLLGRVALLALLALLALAPRLASAQELGVTTEVERPIASTGGEDPTASATEVDATDRPRADEALADALREVPGARPLSTGGYGSPSTLSLRGSDGDQVEVMLGSLPISAVDGGAFDLSVIPLWALDRVEVYRGGSPTWLGASGIGGVVRLVPRGAGASVARGTAGAGSFGLLHARASAGAVDGGADGEVDGEVDWLASAGVSRSDGDFPYVADATLLDGSDDAVERRRENAHVTQASALAHARWHSGADRVEGFALGLYREGGVPGPAIDPTDRARREEGQLLLGLGYERVERDLTLSLAAGLAYRGRALEDPDAEIGLVPRDARDDALRTVVRAGARGDALDWLEVIGVGLWIHEELWPRDALAAADPPSSARDRGRFGVEARLHGRTGSARYELRPSVRLGVVASRLADLRAEAAGTLTDRLDAVPTFRLAGALEPLPGLTLAASASSATRTPTPVELFGDRAFLRGDASLSPERAERFDASVALRGVAGPLRGRAELRGFVTLASDLIRYTRSSRFLSTPQNVDSATLAGAEIGASGTLTPHVALTVAATWLETWTPWLGAERRLPYRPRLSLYARPEARAFALGPIDRLVVYADVAHVGDAFADAANAATIAARTRVGLGLSVELWERRVRLDLGVRDVFDARGVDLLGFPLPGRSLYASLSIDAR